MRSTILTKHRRSTYFTAFMAICLTCAIVANPEESFQASLEGLKIWWEIVLPALLPFFIASELLMGLGVVHFMGALLEPVMKPVFRVPGVGAFAMAMGLASGYPIGAKITGNLRRDNLCSQIEAERLVSICNTADPLFMIGAVAVGMFHLPQLGTAIAGAHYLSSLLLGLLMRYHGKKESSMEAHMLSPRENLLRKALRELYQARARDGRVFGQLLADSVQDSINTLLLIGGCITMFSVIIRVLTLYGILNVLNSILLFILRPIGFTREIITALTSGFFEITIGTEMTSKAAGTLTQRAIAASAIIGWSGLSVHAQVAAMVNGTDIRIVPYMVSRIVHAILAGLLTVVLLPASQTVSVFLLGAAPRTISEGLTYHASPLVQVFHSASSVLVVIGLLLALSVLVHVSRLVWTYFRTN
jgi:sporulation integral membrane protein YlbJ